MDTAKLCLYRQNGNQISLKLSLSSLLMGFTIVTYIWAFSPFASLYLGGWVVLVAVPIDFFAKGFQLQCHWQSCTVPGSVI